MAIRLKMVDSFRNDEASQLRWLIQAQLQTNLFMEIVEFILTEKKKYLKLLDILDINNSFS